MHHIHTLSIGLLLATVPNMAMANAGVPMLAIMWPLQWLLLIPVVLFEGEIAHRRLFIPWSRCMKATILGNLASTFIGIPLAWAAMLAVEFSVLHGVSLLKLSSSHSFIGYALWPFTIAWIYPTDNPWVVYLAFVLLAIPFCLVSIAIEFRVARSILIEAQQNELYSWARAANIRSYIFLVIIAALYPILK